MKKICLLSLSIVFVTSCSDFDLNNPNSVDSNVFASPVQRLDELLVGAYSALQFSGVMGANFAITSGWFSEASTIPANNTIRTSTVSATRGLYNSADDLAEVIYADTYVVVNRANTVLDQIDSFVENNNLKANDPSVDVLKGEALFLRSLGLFWLSNTFNLGNIVMPLTAATGVNESFLPLTSKEEVLNQIISDLRISKNLLSEVTTRDPEELGRATFGAATALLGKVLLYAEEFDDAAIEFEEVLSCNDCGYALASDLNLNFNEKGEHNSESIFEVGFLDNIPFQSNFGRSEGSRSNESTLRGTLFAGGGSGGGFGFFNPSQFIANLYKNEVRTIADSDATETVTIAGKNNVILSGQTEPESLEFSFELENVPRLYSKRAQASMAFEDDGSLFFQQSTREGFTGGKFVADATRSAVRKFQNWETSGENTTSPINERVIRLADVYLMHAEALMRSSSANARIDDAILSIDEVRSSRGLVPLRELFEGVATPPIAKLYLEERSELYRDVFKQALVTGSLQLPEAILKDPSAVPISLRDLLKNDINAISEVTLDNLIDNILESNALGLDLNRVESTLKEVISTLPNNLKIPQQAITPENIVNHLFNKERPAEFAFEGHGILWNDLRRRPGGALLRLRELSVFNYVDIVPDAKLSGAQQNTTSAFQAQTDQQKRYFQDFVERSNNIQGSRLRSQLYLPIPFIALNENSALRRFPELLTLD